MAVSNYTQLQAFPAGEDLSKAHGIMVKLNEKGQIVKCTAATDPVIGVVIIPLPYVAGDDRNCPGTCTERGVKVPAVASAAIAVGDTVGLAAGGKIVKSTSGYVGVALEAATAADDVITILFLGQVGGSASAGSGGSGGSNGSGS